MISNATVAHNLVPEYDEAEVVHIFHIVLLNIDSILVSKRRERGKNRTQLHSYTYETDNGWKILCTLNMWCIQVWILSILYSSHCENTIKKSCDSKWYKDMTCASKRHKYSSRMWVIKYWYSHSVARLPITNVGPDNLRHYWITRGVFCQTTNFRV